MVLYVTFVELEERATKEEEEEDNAEEDEEEVKRGYSDTHASSNRSFSVMKEVVSKGMSCIVVVVVVECNGMERCGGVRMLRGGNTISASEKAPKVTPFLLISIRNRCREKKR